MARLKYKLHITGKIIVETGLHIGGSEVDLDIGGIDKEVIKVKQGKNKVPYIPGSSLKGKLRTLLGRSFGYEHLRDDKGEVLALFAGTPIPRSNKKDKLIPSRLIFRDSYAIQYQLEDKAENVIDRVTGVANPRHLERVTQGTSFGLDLILDVYDNDNVTQHLQVLDRGFQILKRDYLGGSGTRGYGKVNITELKINKIKFTADGDVDIDHNWNEYIFKSNQ